MALVNIDATDLMVVLNAKNDEKFSSNARIRNEWIPKQYMVHRDELVAKRRMYAAKKKGKERHIFLERKDMNTSRRKIPPRFVVPHLVSSEQEWHVVHHKKFSQKLTRT